MAAGYRGILSNNDAWYLDHLYTEWQTFYTNDPMEGITNATQQELVLGGEVCMWGETVDASDLFNTVWPRAAAAAVSITLLSCYNTFRKDYGVQVQLLKQMLLFLVYKYANLFTLSLIFVVVQVSPQPSWYWSSSSR